jgi:SM-20-related protein
VNHPYPVDVSVYDYISDKLAEQGYCIVNQLLDDDLLLALTERVMNLDDEDLTPAGIGRDQDHQLKTQIRRDQTRWLNPDHPIDARYLAQMGQFRLAINRRLFLGLFDYESHYAYYPEGAFYKKHLDAFKGESNRVLTTVLYFNSAWQHDEGGELLIYHPDSDAVIEKVKPELGTFVIFLSEQFPHEVVESKRDRYSIAGWFRIQDPLQAPSI